MGQLTPGDDQDREEELLQQTKEEIKGQRQTLREVTTAQRRGRMGGGGQRTVCEHT